MVGRYIHIGGPKCASKSLQQGFFAVHPDLHHLGMGTAKGMTTWPSAEIQRGVEVGIRLKKDFAYDGDGLAALFARHFDQAAARSGIRRVGMSYENLTLTLTHDVDLTAKARRLRGLFGPDTRVIFLFRDQRKLIVSLFAEFLASGMRRGFQDFVDFLIESQYRSPLSDLFYAKVVDLYSELFGAENLLAVPLEVAVADPRAFTHRLSDFLGVSRLEQPLPRLNPSLTPSQLAVLLRLNMKTVHNLGASQTDVLHAHRLESYVRDELQRGISLDSVLDYQLLSFNYRLAAQLGAQAKVAPLDLGYRADQIAYLDRYYGRDNERLVALLGLDPARLGYPGLAPAPG